MHNYRIPLFLSPILAELDQKNQDYTEYNNVLHIILLSAREPSHAVNHWSSSLEKLLDWRTNSPPTKPIGGLFHFLPKNI